VTVPPDARPAVAGIWTALGDHRRAGWVRIAGPMARGQRYAGQLPLRRRRTRTGRTWHDQQRDGDGRWTEGWIR